MKKRALSMVLALVMLLSLVPASVWAEPAAKTVSSEAEFAKMDENGSYRLTKDIKVTAPYEKDFSGTFDGNGHTVTLNIPGSNSNVALFKTVAGGTVKNVATTGSVSGNNNVGGIAGTAKSGATIKDCKNAATINGSKAVGGIVGYSDGASVAGCANTGAVSATGRQVGGIAGNMENSSIQNCYNTAAIKADGTYAGGIAGRAAYGSSVENSYTTGSVQASNYCFAVVAQGYNSNPCKINKVYALGGTAESLYPASGVTISDCEFKTDAEMKASDFAELLGEAFMVKAGDYPALTWETPTAKVAFTISPENAVLTIGGNTYTGSCEVALAAGSYDYTVSCGGYTSKTGSVTVVDENGTLTATPDTVSVTLEEDASAWSRVTFDVTPASASLKVLDGEAEMLPAEDGSYKLLKNHAYTYTASTTEEGYEAATGSVTPGE